MSESLFSIFCKSYAPDIYRVVQLAESVEKYNQDKIPFYVSCPDEDLSLFKTHLSSFSIEVISDQEIIQKIKRSSKSKQNTDTIFPPHLMQQVVKSEFWRLGVSENYLVIDSDSYFIRPFFVKDFLFNDEIPYTVMHECKDLLAFAARSGKKKVHHDYTEIRNSFQKIFNRDGKCFDFGPTPVIWSSKVWKDLYENYATPLNTDIYRMIESYQSELLWYGEALLHFNSIPIIPIEPLFKVYHYEEQFVEGRQMGENDKVLSQNYFGVVSQSNWNKSLGFSNNKKKTIRGKIKDFFKIERKL